MYACSDQSFVLEHFLRLDTSSPESWLSALQALTGSPQLSKKVLLSPENSNFRACLSLLRSDELCVCGFYLKNASLIGGANAETTAIVMPVEGTVNFEVMDGHYLCSPWMPFVLDPHEEFHAKLSEETHLIIIQLTGLTRSYYQHSLQDSRTKLTELLRAFIYETPFFQSHEHALARLASLSRKLSRFIQSNQSLKSVPLHSDLVGDDRRLCKAIQLINQELHKRIGIETIASRAGLSLRSLHYLMKQHIRQTPYQYIRNRRLIKARAAIIRNHPEKISIAEQALHWGFQHPGRFSSYYHKHFGQYPTETLRELEHLKQFAGNVTPTGSSRAATKEYWLTSSAPQRTFPLPNRDCSQQDS